MATLSLFHVTSFHAHTSLQNTISRSTFATCSLATCSQTCLCPFVTFGQIAEIVDEGQTTCAVHGVIYGLLCFVGIPCVYSFMWRQKLRRKFRLEKGACGDFCVHCCCESCALCQEHRELQKRGLDPSLGWEVARQYLGRTMDVPTPQGGMQR